MPEQRRQFVSVGSLPGVSLQFWLDFNAEHTVATVCVRKHGNDREQYPIVSLLSTGECCRHPGLPVGWGFALTKERKIKEVR